jgi:predicted nucleic acid-binding protein
LSICRALLNPKANIPESRKTALKKVLEDFYGTSDFSPEILQQAAEIEYRYSMGYNDIHSSSVHFNDQNWLL